MAQRFPLYYLGEINGRIISIRGRPVLLPEPGDRLDLTEYEIRYVMRRYAFDGTDFVPFTRDKRVRDQWMSKKAAGAAVSSTGQVLSKDELLAMLEQIEKSEKKPETKPEPEKKPEVKPEPKASSSEEVSLDELEKLTAPEKSGPGRPKKDEGAK